MTVRLPTGNRQLRQVYSIIPSEAGWAFGNSRLRLLEWRAVEVGWLAVRGPLLERSPRYAVLETYQPVRHSLVVPQITIATPRKPGRGNARNARLDAALALVRKQGWAATGVDQLCTAAGVTTGAFFHHFATSDPIRVAVTAKSLAIYAQTVLQGGFVLSKATGERSPLSEAIGHLKRYLKLLFRREKPR